MEENGESEGKTDNLPGYTENKELARAAGDDESDADPDMDGELIGKVWSRPGIGHACAYRTWGLPILPGP